MRRDPERRFLFRLCLALGIWNVDGLADIIPASLVYEWMAYFALEPWGEERADLRAATIQRTIAQCSGNKSATVRKFLEEYDFDGDRPEKSAARSMLQQKAATLTLHHQVQGEKLARERMEAKRRAKQAARKG